jgi:hypothetical protein
VLGNKKTPVPAIGLDDFILTRIQTRLQEPERIEGVVKAKVQKGKEPKDKYVPKTWNSVPYWVVRMKANGFYHRLAENELTFVK